MPDDVVDNHLNGVQGALAAGWRVLDRGGRAVDAIQEAIIYMEEDETFDAGRGSFLTRDGKVQLDAIMMDGNTLRSGGVGCVERRVLPSIMMASSWTLPSRVRKLPRPASKVSSSSI